MDSLTAELIKIEINNITVVPLLAASLFYLIRFSWLKIANYKKNSRKRLQKLPEIVFPIKDLKNSDNSLMLFKKAFINPKDNTWLKKSFLPKNNTSNVSDVSNPNERKYFNRNLDSIINYISSHNNLFDDKEVNSQINLSNSLEKVHSIK